MSTHTSIVSKRIEKARHFHACIAGIHAPDWQVVAYFYAALHWMAAAYEHQTGESAPDSHLAAKRVYGTGHAVPLRIYRAYRDLQSYAEYVRYELEPPLEEENLEEIVEKFNEITAWTAAVLGITP